MFGWALLLYSAGLCFEKPSARQALWGTLGDRLPQRIRYARSRCFFARLKLAPCGSAAGARNLDVELLCIRSLATSSNRSAFRIRLRDSWRTVGDSPLASVMD